MPANCPTRGDHLRDVNEYNTSEVKSGVDATTYRPSGDQRGDHLPSESGTKVFAPLRIVANAQPLWPESCDKAVPRIPVFCRPPTTKAHPDRSGHPARPRPTFHRLRGSDRSSTVRPVFGP